MTQYVIMILWLYGDAHWFQNLQASPQLCLDEQLIGLHLCVFKRQ